MVIRLDPITRCTHLAESLLEQWRLGQGTCPGEALRTYADWLNLVVTGGADVDEILAQAETLESGMNACI